MTFHLCSPSNSCVLQNPLDLRKDQTVGSSGRAFGGHQQPQQLAEGEHSTPGLGRCSNFFTFPDMKPMRKFSYPLDFHPHLLVSIKAMTSSMLGSCLSNVSLIRYKASGFGGKASNF